MSSSEHAPAFHVQHALTMLIVHVPGGTDQAHIGFGAHGAGFQNGVLEAQSVIGEDGLLPLNVLKPWRTQAGRFL